MMAVQLSTFPLSVKTEIVQFVMTGEGKGGGEVVNYYLAHVCIFFLDLIITWCIQGKV